VTAATTFDFDGLRARLEPQCKEIIGLYEDSRSALIPLVRLFQDHEGYASPAALAAVAEMLALPLSVIESTISFYSLFFRKPIGKYMLQVCRGLSCVINDSEDIMAHFRARLGIGHHQTTDDGLFSYEEVECLAACDRAPCMQINWRFKYDLTPQGVDDMLAALRAGTSGIAPLAQTKAPGKSWHVESETRKSAGGVGVSHPNNAGGVGDRSGVIMLDRVLADPSFAERSHERLVHETNLRPTSGDEGYH
jgi:NADH-quinone oxidoreductase subunit E